MHVIVYIMELDRGWNSCSCVFEIEIIHNYNIHM